MTRKQRNNGNDNKERDNTSASSSYFSGKSNDIDVHEWIIGTERWFNTIKIYLDEDQIEVATYYLTDSAQAWWATEKKVNDDGTDKYKKWVDFKEAIKKQFPPNSLVNRHKLEIATNRIAAPIPAVQTVADKWWKNTPVVTTRVEKKQVGKQVRKGNKNDSKRNSAKMGDTTSSVMSESITNATLISKDYNKNDSGNGNSNPYGIGDNWVWDAADWKWKPPPTPDYPTLIERLSLEITNREATVTEVIVDEQGRFVQWSIPPFKNEQAEPALHVLEKKESVIVPVESVQQKKNINSVNNNAKSAAAISVPEAVITKKVEESPSTPNTSCIDTADNVQREKPFVKRRRRYQSQEMLEHKYDREYAPLIHVPDSKLNQIVITPVDSGRHTVPALDELVAPVLNEVIRIPKMPIHGLDQEVIAPVFVDQQSEPVPTEPELVRHEKSVVPLEEVVIIPIEVNEQSLSQEVTIIAGISCFPNHVSKHQSARIILNNQFESIGVVEEELVDEVQDRIVVSEVVMAKPVKYPRKIPEYHKFQKEHSIRATARKVIKKPKRVRPKRQVNYPVCSYKAIIPQKSAITFIQNYHAATFEIFRCTKLGKILCKTEKRIRYYDKTLASPSDTAEDEIESDHPDCSGNCSKERMSQTSSDTRSYNQDIILELPKLAVRNNFLNGGEILVIQEEQRKEETHTQDEEEIIGVFRDSLIVRSIRLKDHEVRK